MLRQPFTIEGLRPIRKGMTVSRDSGLGEKQRSLIFRWGNILPSVRKAMTE